MKASTLKSAIMRASGKPVSVEFFKKDGTLRSIVGTYQYVDGHDNDNPTRHIPKYITLVTDIDGKQTWRNVNTETIQSLAINGKLIFKKG